MDVLYPIIYNNNPVTLSLPKINAEKKIVAFQDYNPAFNFYLPHNVEVIQKIDSLKLISQQQQITVLTRKDRLPILDTTIFRIQTIAHDIFENPTSAVLFSK